MPEELTLEELDEAVSKLVKAREANQVCGHCGQPGAILKPVYIGGGGYVEVLRCPNVIECWKRWDKQHELEGLI